MQTGQKLLKKAFQAICLLWLHILFKKSSEGSHTFPPNEPKPYPLLFLGLICGLG